MKSKKNIVLRASRPVPPYPMTFSIIVARDPMVAYDNFVRSRGVIDKPTTPFEARCLTHHGERSAWLFFRSRNLAHGTIAHEIAHAVHFLMDMIGHPIAFEGDEPIAYVTQDLHEWVYDRLKKARIRVR